MAKYRVYLETTASLTVTVDVPDNLDGDEASIAAIEAAYEELPRSICANCSGWGEPWSRDLGEWEIAQDGEGNETPPEKVG